jgi:hypothetical protein
MRWTNSGTDRVGGGSYERPFLMLIVFGADGLVTRLEWFDPDREAEALARFDELTAERPGPRIENAATRAVDQLQEAWAARDWGRLELFHAAELRAVDRRMIALPDLDRDRYLEAIRMRFEMSRSRLAFDVLATRGDRLALVRSHFEGADRDVGPSETEQLVVGEVDDAGRFTGVIFFNPDDLDAAYAELDARFDAGEGARSARRVARLRAFGPALAGRDWDALSAMYSPYLAVTDHRPLGWETIRGPSQYVASLRSLVELAPDVQFRIDHVILSDRATFLVFRWVGTRDGGPFEIAKVSIEEIDEFGRVLRIDVYDLDQLDEARARFAAIRPDPLRIPPNAATRNGEHWKAAYEAEDWEALRANCSPELVFDDRRRSILLTGDLETFVANNRWLGKHGRTRIESTLLATAGERLMLNRLRFTAGEDDVLLVESETLVVSEVDEEGRAVAIIQFDPEDRGAASVELLDRYARGELARAAPPALSDMIRAVLDHDLARVRAVLPDDFFFHDRRRTGAGRIEGADTYVAYLAALFEQSPDAIIEPLYQVATAEHGILDVAHIFGLLANGGAFETVFARLMLFRGERLLGAELFEIEDLDVARVRFEALGAEPRS